MGVGQFPGVSRRPVLGVSWRVPGGPVSLAIYLQAAAPKSIIGKPNGGCGGGASQTADPEQPRFGRNIAGCVGGPSQAASPERAGSDYEIARHSSGPSQTAAPEQAGSPYQIAQREGEFLVAEGWV